MNSKGALVSPLVRLGMAVGKAERARLDVIGRQGIVERLITYPLEIAMANITDVIEIRSISRYGLSVITVVFKDKVIGVLPLGMIALIFSINLSLLMGASATSSSTSLQSPLRRCP